MDGQLKIRNVYLSDLHFIRSIYNEAKSNADATASEDVANTNASAPLTEAFGLPLVLVDCQKQAIGYAFVVSNSSNESEIKQLFRQGFEQKEIEETMKKHAEKVLRSMQENCTHDHFRLDIHIKKFIDWLNWCT